MKKIKKAINKQITYFFVRSLQLDALTMELSMNERWQIVRFEPRNLSQ